MPSSLKCHHLATVCLFFIASALLSQNGAPQKFIEGYCDCSTPLSVAINRNDADSVKTLVAQSADVTMKYYDRHLRQGDKNSLPGRTTLDLAQINLSHRSRAARERPSVETQTAFERACSIYAVLKEHGAAASSAGSRFGSGDPACGASKEEKSSTMESLAKQDAVKDQQKLLLDQSRAMHLCSTGAMASFYNCACFTDKVMEYRTAHGTQAPLGNIIDKVDYSSCLGPPEPMAKYASDRAQNTLRSSRLDDATKEKIAACTGPAVASAYRAQYAAMTDLRMSIVDGLFLRSFGACTQKYQGSAR